MFFGVFQIISRDINKRALIKIGIGLIYTYIGLVVFLTGVNVGFMPAGNRHCRLEVIGRLSGKKEGLTQEA